MGIAVHLAVAGDVFGGVFLCCPFSHGVSCMKPGTLLSQFLRDFLRTLVSFVLRAYICQGKFTSEHFLK